MLAEGIATRIKWIFYKEKLMEIIDMRSNNVDKNIKIGDVLEIIHPEDHRHEYWFVGYNGEFVEEGEYSLVNLESGSIVFSIDFDRDICDELNARVDDWEVVDAKLSVSK